MVEIIKVSDNRSLREFIEFPNILYKNDPCYVPLLHGFAKELFSKKKNPFFRHSKADLFLAVKDRKPCGRVVAIRNNMHLRQWNDDTGFFGFFETTNDYEVAESLLDRVSTWMRSEDLHTIVGPENYTTNESCGFLISGFEKPPCVMMPYNMDYYPKFIERYGYSPILDLSSYMFKIINFQAREEALLKRLDKRMKKRGITYRSLDFSDFDRDMSRLRLAYNESFKENWGYVPISEAEFRGFAKHIRKITEPEMVQFAIHENRIVGFCVSIYDVNQLVIHIRRGRIFPAGIFSYLKYRNRIDQARILILGVLPEYRNIGIDVILYHNINNVISKKRRLKSVEAAYVMQNNHCMQAIIEKLGATVVKNYRLYQLHL